MTTEEARQLVAGVPMPLMQHADEIIPFLVWLADRKPVNILEIGVGHGGTSYLWGHVAPGLVIGIDLPHGAITGMRLSQCQKRDAQLHAWNRRYRCVLGDSHDVDTFMRVMALLGDQRVDLLYIDGDHTAAGVQADLDDYRTFLKPGGTVALHDITVEDYVYRQGVQVRDVWRTLDGEKIEFSVRGEWGGIGVWIP